MLANASWTKYQRYEWTYSLQSNPWKGPRPFAGMIDAMWTQRGDATSHTTATSFPGNATNVATTAATPGSANSLTINEWMAGPAYGNDWLELYNSGSTPVALDGLYLSDNASTPTTTRTFNLTVSANLIDADHDGLPDYWENANGLLVGSDDSANDADHDGQPNLAEFQAGTDPQSSASVFAVRSISAPLSGQVTLTWEAIGGTVYQAWSSQDLITWTAVEPTLRAPSSGTLSTTVPTDGSGARYFRLSIVP